MLEWLNRESGRRGSWVANVRMSVAEWEREIIGQRTREGLAVKRAQGVRLGRPRSLPVGIRARIRRMRNRGMSLEAIARKLNDEDVPTAHGGRRWYASTVRAVIA